MSWALCLLLLTAVTVLFAVQFNRKFEETLPIAVLSVILLLYLFGLADLLEAGLYTVLAVCLLAGAAGVTLTVARKKTRQVAALILTPAFCLFVLASGVVWLLDAGMQLSSWDEFSHWGKVAKAVYSTNHISLYSQTDLLFRSYPPAMALWQYFVLWFRGAWSEADLFRSYVILGMALFLPFLRNVGWKDVAGIVFAALVTALTPMLFFSQYYAIVYIDPALAVFFGYCLAEAFLYAPADKTSAIRLALAMAVLPILKESGLFFALLAGIVFLCKASAVRASLLSLKQGARASNLLVLLVPLATYGLWQLTVRLTNTPLVFSGKVDWTAVFNALTGFSQDYRSEVLGKFVSSFLTVKFTFGVLPLPFIVWSVLLLAVPLLFLLVDRENAPISKKTAILLAAGLLVYLFGLLLLYWFNLSEHEALSLTSYQRYIGTYLQGAACFAAMALAFGISGKRRTLPLTVLRSAFILLLALSIPVSAIGRFMLCYNAKTADAKRTPYQAVVEKAASLRIPSDEKIWIISQHTTGFDYLVLQYELMQYRVNPNFTWSLGDKSSDSDIWTQDLSADEWKRQLFGYDYVLIYSVDDSFINRYQSLFTGADAILPNTLYEVQKDGGELRLAPR